MRQTTIDGALFLVFDSQEERDLYIKTERSGAHRSHRERLRALSDIYLQDLHSDPAHGDDHHDRYMSAVKKEYEIFARENARLENNERYLLLESDLKPIPAP